MTLAWPDASGWGAWPGAWGPGGPGRPPGGAPRRMAASTGPYQGAHGLRERLSPGWRRGVRRVADAALGPLLGSIKGFSTDLPLVALTFDDGPDPEGTRAVLEALADHGAKATFFLLSSRAERHPDICQQIVSSGHQVGFHGPEHRSLRGEPFTLVREKMAKGLRSLEAASGVRVDLFRPPFGAQSLASYLAARSLGLEVVVWATMARDWEAAPYWQLADSAVAGVLPGDIVLLHDAFEPGPRGPSQPPVIDRHQVTAEVCQRLRERNLTSVSIRELAASGKAVRTAWFRP